MEPPVLIRRRCQTRCCHHTHAGQALFTVVLHTVAIDVVEDLAKHVCAIEGLIRHDTNPCRRLTGQGLARQAVDDLRAVDELAFANTGADGKQQDNRASGAAEVEAIPHELAEARRIAIHNLLTLQGCAYRVADRDGVWDELPASDVEQLRRFSDRECSRELRVERNVVVVDLVRAGHRAAVQGEIQVVLSPNATRGHGEWRRELRRLCLAVRDGRKSIRRTGKH